MERIIVPDITLVRYPDTPILGQPGFVAFDSTTPGNNAVLSLVDGRKIRVMGYEVNNAAGISSSLIFVDDLNNPISGPINAVSRQTITASSRFGLMEAAVGRGLGVSLPGGPIHWTGTIWYVMEGQ